VCLKMRYTWYTLQIPPKNCFNRDKQWIQLGTLFSDKPYMDCGCMVTSVWTWPLRISLSPVMLEFPYAALTIIHWFIMIFPLQMAIICHNYWSGVFRHPVVWRRVNLLSDWHGPLLEWSLRNVRPALRMESLATRASFPCHPKLDVGSWILG
jgi:hypothetical protein